MLSEAFNGADILGCIGLVVGLWFLVRPLPKPEQEES